MPVDRPYIENLDPGSVRLRWNRLHIPSFRATDDELTYIIEIQQPPDYKWREYASKIPDTSYVVKGLEPKRDYRFRVRAYSPLGVTEPSPPVTLYGSMGKFSSSRRQNALVLFLVDMFFFFLFICYFLFTWYSE